MAVRSWLPGGRVFATWSGFPPEENFPGHAESGGGTLASAREHCSAARERPAIFPGPQKPAVTSSAERMAPIQGSSIAEGTWASRVSRNCRNLHSIAAVRVPGASNRRIAACTTMDDSHERELSRFDQSVIVRLLVLGCCLWLPKRHKQESALPASSQRPASAAHPTRSLGDLQGPGQRGQHVL